MHGNHSSIRARRTERGFTFLGLLFVIAMLGIALSAVGVVWSAEIRRDREVQLLFVGDQIRAAIGHYYREGGQYPQALTDLLEDKRVPQTRRYLRRLYPDPMTNSADWQPIVAPQGGIMGVASSSQLKPIKVANFPQIDASFEKTECYCDWKFVYSAYFGRRHRLIKPVTPP